jgi:hypothetical protein
MISESNIMMIRLTFVYDIMIIMMMQLLDRLPHRACAAAGCPGNLT